MTDPIDLTSERFHETAHRLNMLNAELRASSRLRAERRSPYYEPLGHESDWRNADDQAIGGALCRLVQALGDDLRTPELSLVACLALRDHFRGPPPHTYRLPSGDVGEDLPDSLTDAAFDNYERVADARAELRDLKS